MQLTSVAEKRCDVSLGSGIGVNCELPCNIRAFSTRSGHVSLALTVSMTDLKNIKSRPKNQLSMDAGRPYDARHVMWSLSTSYGRISSLYK
jgi:hypothetical protein